MSWSRTDDAGVPARGGLMLPRALGLLPVPEGLDVEEGVAAWVRRVASPALRPIAVNSAPW
jgi:hypothetical protein